MTSITIQKVNVAARWSHNALADHPQRSMACCLCQKDVTLSGKGDVAVEACGARFHSECWAVFVARRSAEGHPNPPCTQCHKSPLFVTVNVTKGE